MLSQRLAWRRKLLRWLGVLFIGLALTLNWSDPEDPALPQTQHFILLLGVLVFLVGWAMTWHRTDNEQRSEVQSQFSSRTQARCVAWRSNQSEPGYDRPHRCSAVP